MLDRVAEIGTMLPHEGSADDGGILLVLSLALLAVASRRAFARWVLWLKMAVAEAVKAWVRAVCEGDERVENGCYDCH